MLVWLENNGHQTASQGKRTHGDIPQRPDLLAARDWWARSGILIKSAWSGLKGAPSLFWPTVVAFLTAATGLYVAEGLDSPLGLTGLIVGPGFALWLVTMAASALALSLHRAANHPGTNLSFGRSLRMLLEHRKRLSHRVSLWVAVEALAAGALVVMVAVITAAALFLPGSQVLLGLFLGIEVLALSALFPVSIFVGAGLAIQPLRACLPADEASFKSDWSWWRQTGEAKTWMATGLLLSAAAGSVGLMLGLAALEAVLELNHVVIPTGMREVLSASVLAPLLGMDRAIEPSLGLQVAGAAASAGICAALAFLATPAVALWSAAAAAAALVSGSGPEDRPKD